MKTFGQLRKNINEKFLDIDNLRHAKVEEKPVNNYEGDYKNLKISEPSENTSSQTRLELKTMQGLMKGRTPEIEQSVKNHDKKVAYAVEETLKKNNLKYKESTIEKLSDIGSGIVRYYKNKFQRIRPYNLAQALEIDFDHMSLDSNSMKTPAYPSGHSLQSRLIAMYYAEKYPEHKQALMMAADECGEGRIAAGWHYPSDHYASVKLAKQIYPNIKISMNESVIDIPRRTYAPNVFDDEDTNDPKIKASVKAMIDKQIKEFEKEYPVIKTTLIGSILTKRYRNDADLDINVLFDVPLEKQEDERLRLSKQFLSSKNPDNIQGKLIPGTKHPVNYYMITDRETYDSQNEKADAVFDIESNRFIKRPEDFTFDINLYLKDFEKKVQEIDVIKGELKRDVIDYDDLKELEPSDVRDIKDRVDNKVQEIKKDLQDIIDIGDKVDAERRAAFDRDMTPDEIRAFGIKNRLPKAVIYKMLEKYHYITFFKRCKEILDDGEVSDDEIDSLKGGYVESAQSETRAVHEALGSSKKLTFAFGRFNPPTTGHAKLMREVITQARKNNTNHIVYASASQDSRKNPLDVNTKVRFMKKMFPQNKIQAAGGTQRTFMEILKFYNKMYGEIFMVAGSDRIREFQALADKYNGKEYNYKSIKVVSSGERDPDAEGVTGMSASKMRDMAKSGDYRNFARGVVGLSSSDTRKLYDAVRKGMDIRESYVDKFTDFINNDIREEYHQEKIFNVGDMVEHMDGSHGMVVRRGSNYVSYEVDGLIKKAWLYDLQPLDEAPRIPRKKGQPAGSDKHSDLYTDENPKGTIHGLGFKDVAKARASVAKIKSSGKKHAHKIQAAIAMEQRAKEMGKTREAAVFRRYIEQMKKKTKEMQKSKKESFLDNLEKAFPIDEYNEIGTDEYAQHTMKMTPGQPIQNFRKYTEIIKSEDIEKFAIEDETIDKYKKRFKERWKEELDKAVQRMKKEL
jgi:nicotinic acid mononucleotide adenylyltransferase/predicted nucleotidyltransferase/predicted transcriptional regulator